MTQRAAAEALGISAVHLSNVERGVTPPSASLIERLTALYKVDVWVLAYYEDEQGGGSEVVRQARRRLAEALLGELGGAVEVG